MAYRVPGPCTITYKSGDLGITKNGVIIRPNTGIVPITDDARGAEPSTFLFGGKSCIVELIGLEIPKLSAATLWDDVFGLGEVGELASEAGGALVITERD